MKQNTDEITAAGLDNETELLVRQFASALAVKLARSQAKYGFTNNWAEDDWEDECRADLMYHIEKGDPIDVAAYCAFMWSHGWPTK